MKALSKLNLFNSLLEEGIVSIQVDAQRKGVVLPSPLKEAAQVLLQYGLDMAVPIPDLEVTENGISATLSFNREPQKTFVPWSAVFVISCDEAAVFYPGSASIGQAEPVLEEDAVAKPTRPALKLV